MPKEKKEIIIEHIELEICGFGSLRVALKEFRRLTGNSAIRKLSQLSAYLKIQSDDTLIVMSEKLNIRLDRAAFPRAI